MSDNQADAIPEAAKDAGAAALTRRGLQAADPHGDVLYDYDWTPREAAEAVLAAAAPHMAGNGEAERLWRAAKRFVVEGAGPNSEFLIDLSDATLAYGRAHRARAAQPDAKRAPEVTKQTTCRGCGEPLGSPHCSGCPYWHPWPRHKVDNVQTQIDPLTEDAERAPRPEPRQDELDAERLRMQRDVARRNFRRLDEKAADLEARTQALADAVQVAVQELPLTLVDSKPSDHEDGPSRAGARLRLALRAFRGEATVFPESSRPAPTNDTH